MLTLTLLGCALLQMPVLNVQAAPLKACSSNITVTNGNGAGAGSLYQAVNDICDGGTITFNNDYTISLYYQLSFHPLQINHNMTIDGSGHKIVLDGMGGSNIITVNSTYNLTLKNMTLQNSGIGALYNEGTTTIINSAFLDNNAIGQYYNGAIENVGDMDISNSTFARNSSSYGAIYHHYGSLTISNSTFVGNVNTQNSRGSSLYYNGGSLSITNTIFADGSGRNCSILGSSYTQNRVIADDGSCTGDSSNPLVGAPGNYGGNTLTVPLLPGSPAIDAGSGCPTGDQRGLSRVGACDLGAFESQGFTLSKSGGDNQSTFSNNPFVLPLKVNVTAINAVEPVNGGLIFHNVPATGASASFDANAYVISNGSAGANVTANNVAGNYNVILFTPGSSSQLAFSLTNYAPEVSIGGTLLANGGSYDFGRQLVNEYTAATFTIRNNGTSAITFDAASSISGTHADQFNIQSQPATPLNGGDSTSLIVHFLPTSLGTKTASLTLHTSHGDYVLNLSGSAVTPASIHVSGNGVEISNGDDSPSAGDGTDFGELSIRPGNSRTYSFNIQNSGGYDLLLNGSPAVNIGGDNAADFSVTSQPSTIVGGAGSTAFNITFTPSATGTRSATISINNNDDNANPFTFAIQGSGLDCQDAIIVTNNNDSGAGSLRQAINDICADGTIDFSVSDGSTIALTSTLPVIDSAITLIGPGAGKLNISGSSQNRIFYIDSDGNLSLSGFTIISGNSSERGGAIYNLGTLNVAGSTFRNNVGIRGGAIYNSGITNIANTTFYNNRAINNSGGGAIYNETSGTANLTNITLNENIAVQGRSILNQGFMRIANSIAVSDIGSNTCYNASLINITGENLDSDGSCTGFNIHARVPRLSNFIPDIASFAPFSDSPVINAAPDGSCIYLSSGSNPLFANGDPVLIDQRGITRPQDGACELGAIEYKDMPPTTMDASDITTTSVTLNALVNPNGDDYTYAYFEYGPDTTYGNYVDSSPNPVSGTGEIAVSAVIGSLAPNTTYHYRITMQNVYGENFGDDKTFTTSAYYKLGNLVWRDTNNNGLRDTGETGINGVNLTLYASSDTDLDNALATSTSANDASSNPGYYEFNNLSAGSYVVVLSGLLPGDWSSGTHFDADGTPTDSFGVSDLGLTAVDNQDNGLSNFSGKTLTNIVSSPITLGPSGASETTGDGDDGFGNLTVDFGLVQTHAITFDANGGSGSMPAQTALPGDVLPGNVFTLSGYIFDSWNTAAAGSGDTYADGAVDDFTTDTTLYAQWVLVPTPTDTLEPTDIPTPTPTSTPEPTDVPTPTPTFTPTPIQTHTPTATATRQAASMTLVIHDTHHNIINSADIGDTLHASVTLAGGGTLPTGTVSFTVYNNVACSGSGVTAGNAALLAGVADPSTAAILGNNGLSYKAHYSGDSNYAAGTSACAAISKTAYLSVLTGSDGTLPGDGASLSGGLNKLYVQFSQDVFHDDSENSHSATHVANYLLVNAGANDSFDTTSCSVGLLSDDRQVNINAISYDAATYTATLNINDGQMLTAGKYRLFICGTTSISNPDETAFLNNEIFDSLISFSVLNSVSIDGFTIPDTGFASGQITRLDPQAVVYADLGGMWLEIPDLKIRSLIVGVPQNSQGKGWDVSWLGGRIGWLNGSAFPTWNGNSVLTGHVWNADNTPGLFRDLKNLAYGDRFYLHEFGQVYTYEVRENRQISSTASATVFKHEDKAWITLLTCEDYDLTGKDYDKRRIVRAVLVSAVTP
ncbi:MAG: sortase [Anaerolineae bacterium]|nr:sortase [Anaerolineae bacterium]